MKALLYGVWRIVVFFISIPLLAVLFSLEMLNLVLMAIIYLLDCIVYMLYGEPEYGCRDGKEGPDGQSVQDHQQQH